MGQFYFNSSRYLGAMRAEVPQYDFIQNAIADTVKEVVVKSVLDLGVGTGETSKAILRVHPHTAILGLDNNQDMLEVALKNLNQFSFDALKGDLLKDFPLKKFDLVVSVFAIHHLKGDLKKELFQKIYHSLNADGAFIFADVVAEEVSNPTPINPSYDFPSRKSELLTWLSEVGFSSKVIWEESDLVIASSHLGR